MGLTIHTLVEEMSAYVIAKQRLWLTADRERLVPEGDRDAAFLFAGVGHRISRADAERYGLLDGAQESQETPPAPDEPDAPSEPVEEADQPDEPIVLVGAPEPEPEPVKRPRGRPRKAQE